MNNSEEDNTHRRYSHRKKWVVPGATSLSASHTNKSFVDDPAAHESKSTLPMLSLYLNESADRDQPVAREALSPQRDQEEQPDSLPIITEQEAENSNVTVKPIYKLATAQSTTPLKQICEEPINKKRSRE